MTVAQPRRTRTQALANASTRQIGRFEMIRELARGGMGQVFLARDVQLGRKVAIKFLLYDDPDFVQRFVVEARATARCTHENIVTIYEVGEHQGLPYMVLEYLEGKTLTQVLEGKQSPRQVVELMLPVLRALARAHEHGIVHRDLKPSNIFVTDRGQVKVLDFGVARMFESPENRITDMVSAIDFEALERGRAATATETVSGALVGTLPYMSPEQWGAGEIDYRSDLWAIGIIFWRALVGVHPVGSTSHDRLRERILDRNALPSLASQDPGLSRELVAIVDRCLAKRKEDRYQSATALLADLQAFLTPAARLDESSSPYRGLSAFGEADARVFFGRDNEIRLALAMIESSPVLTVVGASGVGKSSFVHAGVVPALRVTGGRWRVRVLRPGRTPLLRLVGVLDAPEQGQRTGLVEALRAAPGLFGERVRELAHRTGEQVVLVVDQLEELFTLSADERDRELFLRALLGAADDPSAPVRVVTSLRADFLDRLAAHQRAFAELSRGLFFLAPPDRDSLRDTIERPAEMAGYTFEPGVVEHMLHVTIGRSALPLLSFAASRLWECRDREQRRLTRAAYDAMGGVGGAFARHADDVAAAVPATSQRLLRTVLTRLVTADGTRAVIDRTELLSLSPDLEAIEGIVDHLVRARLVHVQSDPQYGATVELVHEALIWEWPALRKWLEDGQATRAFVQEVRLAARQWAARGKAAELVWRGATAQDALAFDRRQLLDLSEVEREFLAAVTAQMSRARRRRLVLAGSVAGVLALGVAGATTAAVRIAAAEQRARVQAAAAETEANKARAANAEIQRQLDARIRAESTAAAATQEAQMSRGDLERVNLDLRAALAVAQFEKERAESAARAGELATEAANAANARTHELLVKERERVRALEREKQKIYNGGLK